MFNHGCSGSINLDRDLPCRCTPQQTVLARQIQHGTHKGEWLPVHGAVAWNPETLVACMAGDGHEKATLFCAHGQVPDYKGYVGRLIGCWFENSLTQTPLWDKIKRP